MKTAIKAGAAGLAAKLLFAATMAFADDTGLMTAEEAVKDVCSLNYTERQIKAVKQSLAEDEANFKVFLEDEFYQAARYDLRIAYTDLKTFVPAIRRAQDLLGDYKEQQAKIDAAQYDEKLSETLSIILLRDFEEALISAVQEELKKAGYGWYDGQNRYMQLRRGEGHTHWSADITRDGVEFSLIRRAKMKDGNDYELRYNYVVSSQHVGSKWQVTSTEVNFSTDDLKVIGFPRTPEDVEKLVPAEEAQSFPGELLQKLTLKSSDKYGMQLARIRLQTLEKDKILIGNQCRGAGLSPEAP